jgi:hypothetical protein
VLVEIRHKAGALPVVEMVDSQGLRTFCLLILSCETLYIVAGTLCWI